MTAGTGIGEGRGETTEFQRSLPMKRMGAGAVIQDLDGNILVVKPTYKDGWELPGGAVEDGESPAQACRREIREELGLDLPMRALLCVDYNSSDDGYVESLMFLFGVDPLDTETVARIELQGSELSTHRYVSVREAVELLDPRVSRRLDAVVQPAAPSVYLEDQRPLG